MVRKMGQRSQLRVKSARKQCARVFERGLGHCVVLLSEDESDRIARRCGLFKTHKNDTRGKISSDDQNAENKKKK